MSLFMPRSNKDVVLCALGPCNFQPRTRNTSCLVAFPIHLLPSAIVVSQAPWVAAGAFNQTPNPICSTVSQNGSHDETAKSGMLADKPQPMAHNINTSTVVEHTSSAENRGREAGSNVLEDEPAIHQAKRSKIDTASADDTPLDHSILAPIIAWAVSHHGTWYFVDAAALKANNVPVFRLGDFDKYILSLEIGTTCFFAQVNPAVIAPLPALEAGGGAFCVNKRRHSWLCHAATHVSVSKLEELSKHGVRNFQVLFKSGACAEFAIQCRPQRPGSPTREPSNRTRPDARTGRDPDTHAGRDPDARTRHDPEPKICPKPASERGILL
ncbi:hypothetical protein B0T24DRAFT_667603 [Lasiosphaeria ovina]|uniref:Uncharacterized protein n=1 Tax=Lasiosphaeria ovina TaxID=92902 RepID=A0AAE0K5W9_9PEZI|nr:hypothetical protein B0T24DRAFT_667603 [Lasiosphaeria ovina]